MRDELQSPNGTLSIADTLWRGVVLDSRTWGQRAISFTWRMLRAGPHRFCAVAQLMDAERRRLPERDRKNDRLSRRIYTIPKGTSALPKVVETFILPVISWQVALVT
ncbi:MAG: hypothetical protein ACUVTG_15880 [Candidatus Oleimicrobiaceae bacterium]